MRQGHNGGHLRNKALVYVIGGVFMGLVLFAAITPAVAESGQGKALYEEKCASCHGTNGDGKGPVASLFNPAPADFRNPGFWQGDVNQKIINTVEHGHGPMAPIDLSPSQIKIIIDYVSHTFK